MGYVIFNGISSEDLDAVIQYKPQHEFPEKEYDVIHVPGRSGDIIIDKHSYKNVKRTYNLACPFSSVNKFHELSSKIIKWLESANGYAILEDSYEPDVYRKAIFRSEGSLPNLFDTLTAINIEFECKPQRYLKSGLTKYDNVTSNFIKINYPIETIIYKSLPVIRFKLNSYFKNNKSSIKIKITGNKKWYITLSKDKDNQVKLPEKFFDNNYYIVIDCNEQQCYLDNGTSKENANLYINCKADDVNEFPYIINSNSVTIEVYNNNNVIDPSIISIDYQPNWWKL